MTDPSVPPPPALPPSPEAEPPMPPLAAPPPAIEPTKPMAPISPMAPMAPPAASAAPPMGPPMAPPAASAPPMAPPAAVAHQGPLAGVGSVEARAAAVFGGLSGPETLIIGGAALFLIVGEILLGEIFTNSGITFAGTLVGEVLFFTWLVRPRTGMTPVLPAGVVQAIVAAFVIAIVLFQVGDFISTLKNLSGFTALGFASILVTICRWAGAVLMGLGVIAAWMPTTPPTTRPRV